MPDNVSVSTPKNIHIPGLLTLWAHLKSQLTHIYIISTIHSSLTHCLITGPASKIPTYMLNRRSSNVLYV